MIPEAIPSPLMQVHLALCLLGIGAGFVVVMGLLMARRLPFWSALFLSATWLDSSILSMA